MSSPAPAPSTAPAADTPAAAVTVEDASAASSAPKKEWKVADVPEGADPLDYINWEKLKEDNKSMPTTQEGITELLNTMPLTADIMPEKENMNRDFAGIQGLIDETPMDTRAENFKDSGNEAYKLSLRMTKDHKEGIAKREAAEKARIAAGLPKPVMTAQEKKDDDYDVKHLEKLVESARKRLIDAVEYYSQALDVEADGTGKIRPHLKAQIYANRALVHLTMKNYGRAQADCDEALKLEPKNAKAAFRGATAALAVDPPKLERARGYITAGRIVDEKRKKIDWQFRAEQKSMDDLEAKVVVLETAAREKAEAKARVELAKSQADAAYNQTLQSALTSRGMKVGPLVFDFARSAYAEQTKEGGGALPRALLYPPPPAPYSSSTSIGWPLLFLYPDVLQSDFIQECREDHVLADHLAQMFPPNTDYAPWDEQRKYTLDNLSVWIDVRGPNVPGDSTPAQDQAARMLVNPRQTLRAILTNPKLQKKNYVIPGIPTFIVLPKQ